MAGKSVVPTVVLNDNSVVPVMGHGTGDMQTFGDVVKNAILEAMKVGYRHFDTAASYGTEDALGNAIEEALQQGIIKSRDELFITSKLWFTDTHPDRVIPAIKKSLGLLKLEYLDLYLIHVPVTAKPGSNQLFPPIEDISPIDVKAVWPVMEECKKLGLTKSIGVSNFPVKTLENLLAIATITPSVNQIEMNIACQQKEVRQFCKEKGIFVFAYSPLGNAGSAVGGDRVVGNEIIHEIAKAHGKSVAQVALRWLHQQGVGFIARSFNKDRIKQNLEVFNWSLTQEDLEKIDQIKQVRVYEDNPIFKYCA